jgi:hypothetical protein
MDDEERAKLKDQLDRLLLASYDMRHASAGAKYLAAMKINSDALRAFETGVVVSYARPFTRHGVGQLNRDEWAPEDQAHRAVHCELIWLRNKVFAHTDKTDLREVVDVAPIGEIEEGLYVEQHVPLDNLPLIAAVADAQGQRFRMAADEVKARLQG